MDRRSFIRGALFVAASPAIVRIQSLMPVKSWTHTYDTTMRSLHGNHIALTWKQKTPDEIYEDIRFALETFKNQPVFPTLPEERVDMRLPFDFLR